MTLTYVREQGNVSQPSNQEGWLFLSNSATVPKRQSELKVFN